MRRPAVVLVLGLLVAGCGGDLEQPALSGEPTPTTTTLPSVQPLPERGIVSGAVDGVAFWSLDGELLDELPGMTLSSFTEPGGDVFVYVFEPPDTYSDTYRVDLESGRLSVATGLRDGPDVWPQLPAPPAPSDLLVTGHWAWTLSRPGGGVALAQWSGECEVPAAFFLDPGDTTRSVLGGDWLEEPSTTAMGWLPDGRALVDVADDPACGRGSPEPGRWAIDPESGERELLDLPAGVLWG